MHLPDWWHLSESEISKRRAAWAKTIIDRSWNVGAYQVGRSLWTGKIRFDGKIYRLGTFNSQEAALRTCRAKRRELVERFIAIPA